MTDDRTRIEMEIEVQATPEEIWQAIATGPGITSWYVPHQVEERQGGPAVASFGEGEEMQVPGRVAVWDPPNRVVFDGGEGQPGLAFEWLVEARDGGSTVVRLVNTGFGDGGPWDEMYDGMVEGWGMFLTNLQLHLAHFAGRHATMMMPMAMWSRPRDEAWQQLTKELGLTLPLEPGDRVEIGGDDETPELAGTVVATAPARVSLLVDRPAPGTAFIAAEGTDMAGISIWCYLYGEEAAAAVTRDHPRWQAWLTARA